MWIGTVLVATVAAVAAIANWWSRATHRARVEELTKPLVTMAIALLALLVSDDAPSGARIAAVIAFALCLGGDLLLLPRIDRFVAGLASFLAGHVAFAVMFVVLGLASWMLAILATAAVTLVVVVIGRRIVLAAAVRDRALRLPVTAYLVVISSMAVLGWATGIVAAILGATLFVVSDSILGWNKFVRADAWMGPAVMITYHGALLGLALSLVG